MLSDNLLLQLPPQVYFEIVKDWIGLKSICALDSAHCNHRQRDGFLQILQSKQFHLINQVVLIPGVINWLLKRSVIVRSILIFAKVEVALFNYMHTFGSNVETVEIITDGKETNTEILTLLSTDCHNLINLSFTNSDVETPEYKDLLERNPKLQTLHVATLHPYFRCMYTNTDDAWAFLNLHLPQLRALSVNHIKSSLIKKFLMKPLLHAQGRKFGAKIGDDSPVNSFPFNMYKTNAALDRIPTCSPFLVSLSLANVNVGDDTLTKIVAQCRAIVHLDLENSGVGDVGLLSAVTNLQLQSLNIQECTQLTSEGLTHIYTHCADTLHTLYLSRNEWDGPQYAHATLTTLFTHCTHLHTLSYTSDFEESSSLLLSEFTPSLCNLTTLILHGARDSIPHQNLIHVSQHCKKITTLCCVWPRGACFEDSDIPELITGCAHLSHLVVCADRSEALQRNIVLWRSLRRQLLVECDIASAEKFRFDVLKVEV